MLSTTAAYLSVNNNLARQQAAVAATTAVKSATDYYLANIGKVKTVADFIGNYRLFSYAMTAYGLSDKVSAKGLMTKVLDGGVASSSALANTLSDPRYKAFATAFDFAAKGYGRDERDLGHHGRDRGLRRTDPRNQRSQAEQWRRARALLQDGTRLPSPRLTGSWATARC